MARTLIFVFRRAENPGYDRIYSGVLLSIVCAVILWDRYYRRRWLQFQARGWQKVEGTFDEGEIVTMKKGRSNTIAGYEVWLSYEYQAEGMQGGIYSISFAAEEEAEAAQKLLANQRIVVRVAPGKPNRSRILDEDMAYLLPNPSTLK